MTAIQLELPGAKPRNSKSTVPQNIEQNPRTWRKYFKELFPWNQYQLSLFTEAEKNTDNIAVNAVAGSGKTSSIRGLIASLPVNSKIAVMTFNRTIADKLIADPTIPKGRISINTAHGFGLALLLRRFAGRKIEVDGSKYYRIAKQSISEMNNALANYQIDKAAGFSQKQLDKKYGYKPPVFDERTKDGKLELRAFIRFVRNVVGYAMRTLTPLDEDNLIAMIIHFGITLPSGEEYSTIYWGIKLAIACISKGEKEAIELGVISHDEMLYLPWKWDIRPSQKDWVIVDEAQDASPAQIALYKSYARQGAKIAYLGDRHQAIQGFAGSDAYSWDKLKEAFNPKDLPLSVCYRCPTSHLDLARKIVPQIEDAPGAIEGLTDTISYQTMIESLIPGDLVICRFTAPLVLTCLKLIASGSVATVRGKQIGEDLVSLAVAAKCGDCWPTMFEEKLKLYLEPKIEQAIDEGAEETQTILEDKQDCLLYLFNSLGDQCGSFQYFCDKVESLFSDNNPKTAIILSTIHRAKGDEAERVFILASNSLPFLFKCEHEWQEQQELNLTYVAITRSKHSLFFVPHGQRIDPGRMQIYLADPVGGMKLPNE
jgi:DNA helicase-2/ATP-dependent DNA helicase PcrA